MNCELRDYDFVIFALDHYNPLGVVRSLGESGIAATVIAEKSKTDISSYSKYIKEYIRVETAEEGYKYLMNKYSEEKKVFLITCDDRTIEFLDQRYDEWNNRFIGFNAGKSGKISEYMNKYKVLELAKKYGLKTLDTVCVKKNVIPKGIEYPVITKSISPVEGGWKADVHICHSENELKIAYEKIKASTVILQKYIEKKNEYCVDGFCADRGRIMFNAIESTYNYLIPGYYSPYMTVKKFNNPDLREAMEGIMKEIEFEGIYSIEFLIDQDDTYYFSEINFRNSTWSYAATCAGMNLPVLWAKAMVSGKLETAEEDIWVEDFMAMVEPIDYGKRVKPKEIGLGEWLIDFKEAKCAFYYNKEDPEPFIHMCKNWEKFS